MPQWILVVAVPIAVLVLLPFIVAGFLRDVDAGTIRMVSWLNGSTVIYRGPGKSKEIPLLTTGTTLSSKVINVDLDITDQTADVEESGTPRPIKVRVLASAIVSVGDSDTMIKTAANRFFAKSDEEQISTLTDLLTSSGRRAINLLTHDQLFSAKSSARGPRTSLPAVAAAPAPALVEVEDDDDPLAIIIRKACSRELTDLGLGFNSLNIKVVQSEVAEARRRQSAAEAQANADIVAAQQARRAKEAQLEAERAISDKQRELEQTKASNAALVAQAEAKRQEAMGVQRVAELDATQIAQAKADAEKVRIDIEAKARAEGLRITTIAEATAESIRRQPDAPGLAETPPRRRLPSRSSRRRGGSSNRDHSSPGVSSVTATPAWSDGHSPDAVRSPGRSPATSRRTGCVPAGRFRVNTKSIRWSNVDRAFKRSPC